MKLKEWGIIRSYLLVQNKFYEGVHARGVDAILHDTRQEAKYFKEHGCPARHLYWPYCLEFWKEIEDYEELPRLIDEPYALCSGSAGRDLESLDAMVGSDGMRLIVTGQTREGLKERIFQNSRIEARFNCSYRDWMALIRYAEFVVVSAKPNERHVRGGSTVLKALQMGRPVLTDKYHKDYVTDGVSGILVDWSNLAEICEGYNRLSKDKSTRHRMSEAATQEGRAFDYKHSTLWLIECIEKTINGC